MTVTSNVKSLAFRFTLAVLTVSPVAVFAQGRSLSLETAAGLTLHQATATPASFKGKASLQLTATAGSSASQAPDGPKAGKTKGGGPASEAGRLDHLALVEGLEFSNGTIEVDLAGEPAPGATGGARGFVGVAFRVQPDRRTYDCFYLRPTNGRAEDQERRNHTAQYISHPEYTWSKLREETPSRYEAYVDILPAEWIHVKIDVQGDKARFYVNGSAQPTLIVNDVKSGAGGKGAVALWFEGSSVARFANLKITPQ